MIVSMPKKLDKTSLTPSWEMEEGKVYRFKNLLVALAPNDNGVIALDTNDDDVLPFNSTSDFAEWLSDQDIPDAGEITPYQMKIGIE